VRSKRGNPVFANLEPGRTYFAMRIRPASTTVEGARYDSRPITDDGEHGLVSLLPRSTPSS